ncbi:C40 family peptidase [Cohnella caldifontis]|uniref:C40 family peptidase n=1 Tax=Cohnella caldifontis TaxID=3027471 RepID=UPI0023ED592D|nr:C40 family peptidase [Cohnella sp. YIM B05605]
MNITRKVIGTTIGMALFGSLMLTPYAAHAATAKVLTTVEAQHIIANAERLQGKVQYHWGVYDTSKMWFDCSSFTKYLYKKEGINLRWGARKQYVDGIKISKSQLRAGDLVFFSVPSTANRTTKYDRIQHVGIYIGNGKFIHNLSPKYDVTISNLNVGYWKNHYVAAARVKAN